MLFVQNPPGGVNPALYDTLTAKIPSSTRYFRSLHRSSKSAVTPDSWLLGNKFLVDEPSMDSCSPVLPPWVLLSSLQSLPGSRVAVVLVISMASSGCLPFAIWLIALQLRLLTLASQVSFSL
uniref:Uncharacterized protein n=1 Tax=Arundo donax TaxID=35708 RepID=A0A0A9HGE0_ARUDO